MKSDIPSDTVLQVEPASSPAKIDLERRRNRLNTLALIIPGQWMGLMIFYWMRYYPPLRPLHFHTPSPSVSEIAICGTISLLPLVLPSCYFRPRKFERGKFYRRLGIRIFRFLAPDGDFVNQKLRRIDPSYRVIRNRETLESHIRGTISNERAHLMFFLFGLFTQIQAFRFGEYIFATLLAVSNLAFNLYPVMHQRYKRARLRNVVKLGDARTGSSR